MIKNFQFSITNFQPNKGFTLVEMLVVAGITVTIFVAVFSFGQNIFHFNSEAQKNLSAQTDARRVLKTIARELRSASPSSLGAYPIAQANSSSIIFFSNIDDDPYKEQIRYFLDGSELKKGVIKPLGLPLVYDPDDEDISILIRDINNAGNPIFEYFDSSFTGVENPLTEPVSITSIRMVRATFYIEKDPNRSLGPVVVKSQVFLRNLKDNL